MTSERVAIQIIVDIDDEFISDIMCTMFEGGSNYWIHHIRISNPSGDKPSEIPKSTWASNAINGGGSVYVYLDDGEGAKILNKDRLLSGLKMWALTHPCNVSLMNEVGKRFPSIDAGDIDADQADCILQYALFQELVYG
jgi:hypothetical protein